MLRLSIAFVASAVTLRGEKTRPIAKVIKLLEDMKAQLTKEQKDDEAVYEKLSCWCTTNDKEKSASVSAATAHITQLESAISAYTGAINELETKIERAKQEYNQDWEALKKATEVRMEESAKFSGEEKDMLATIDACKQAIVVMSKHHPELAQIKAVARHLQTVEQKVMPRLSASAKDALKRFLNGAARGASFLSIPGFQSYAPQSGQIFGILKQMQEDFQANLSDAQRQEQQARAAFKELKAAKESQMNATRKQQGNFEAALADNMEKKAAAEEDLQDTKEQLSNDQKFLLNLRQRCKETDEEYNARVASRHEEIEAVADTIAVLDSDESFDNFNKALNTAFPQISSEGLKISRVVALLNRFAATEPRFGLIAMSVQLDAFVKVKKAIDDMVTQLKAEKQDEIKHRDFCIEQFNQNERDENAKSDERDDLQTTIDSLSNEIETLNTALTTLNKEIEEMKTQMQRASENRAKENADFQQAVSDQRVTQQILAKARDRMAQKYVFMSEEPQVGAAHTQTSGTKTDPGNGPARFNEYKHSSGGGRVIAMLNKVIADSKALENEAIKDEKDQQTAYEGFIQDSNKSIVSKQKSIVNKTEERAQASEAKTIAENDHAQALADLERLNKYKGELQSSCNFLLKNFDARQTARDQEVDALRQAKDILSGMQ